MSIDSVDFIKLVNSFLIQALRTLSVLLPRRACLAFGGSLGTLLYLADGRHRRLALSNLDRAFGGSLSLPRRRRIALSSFRHFGRMIADDLKWAHFSAARRLALLHVEGAEHIRRALDGGRGVLLFSAHLGNWEVASAAISRMGKLNVVARPLDNRLAETELGRFREGLGASVISKFQAAKPILQALHRNEMVALLIDQNVLRSQGVFVDFFGLPAATTPALAAFHLRSGSPLIPVFCHPDAGLSYRVKIGPPLEVLPSGNWSRDVLQITSRCTKMIEAEIRDNPDQWFWFHHRWKTRPEGESASSGPEAGKSNQRP
jgi:KDO2-lipid IV(A) lauroyltransferase